MLLIHLLCSSRGSFAILELFKDAALDEHKGDNGENNDTNDD
jgi:hypothetical protein